MSGTTSGASVLRKLEISLGLSPLSNAFRKLSALVMIGIYFPVISCLIRAADFKVNQQIN
jgi:hypothetical protein